MRRKATADKDVRAELLRSYREEGLTIARQWEGLGVEGIVSDILDSIRALHEGEDTVVEGWRLEDALFELGIPASTPASRYVVRVDGSWSVADVTLEATDTVEATAVRSTGAAMVPLPPSAMDGTDPSTGPTMRAASSGPPAIATIAHPSPTGSILRT
jgi:hypothetical protein